MVDLKPARPAKPCEDQLKEKDAEIAGLREKLAANDLAAKDAEIAGLREELAAKDAEIAQLKKQVAELQAKPGPYLPPAAPFLPHHPDGPWGKGPGGPGVRSLTEVRRRARNADLARPLAGTFRSVVP